MKGMRRGAFSIGALIVVTLALAPAEPAQAVTVRLVSTTGIDTGDCSLNPCRTVGYAIAQSAFGDIIRVAAGTYAEHLLIDRSLTIVGAGAHSTKIDGSGDGIVVAIGSPSASLSVIVSSITIRNGRAGFFYLQTAYGGGIQSWPGPGYTNRVTLSRTSVVDNTATGTSTGQAALGGGIYNAAGSTMTISASTVANNSAYASSVAVGEGGGIYNAGTLTVSRTTVSGNLVVGGPGAKASHGCIAGQAGSGGGIWGAATIANSTIAINTATGGGGANFFCSGGSAGGNGSGGGLEASGFVTLLNTTISGDAAKGGIGTGGNPSGAGLGGGIHVGGSGSVSVTNTILATGTATTEGPDCDGTVNSGGHNLVSDDGSCSGFTGPGDQVGVDPMLGPLQNNGGPTGTMALLDGSPAIDAADDAVCGFAPVNGLDQRGITRPQGPHCDIGAYERQ